MTRDLLAEIFRPLDLFFLALVIGVLYAMRIGAVFAPLIGGFEFLIAVLASLRKDLRSLWHVVYLQYDVTIT